MTDPACTCDTYGHCVACGPVRQSHQPALLAGTSPEGAETIRRLREKVRADSIAARLCPRCPGRLYPLVQPGRLRCGRCGALYDEPEPDPEEVPQ